MKPNVRLNWAMLWLVGSLSYTTALALSTDADQPIHIDADRGELDDRKQVAVYRGNVQLSQGTLRITADTLTIYYTPGRKLIKAIAEGQPALYQQRPDNSDEDVQAQALRMEYHADNETIYLFQEARVWQGVNQFTGDHIEYDTKLDIVRGQGSKTGTGRVHVIIHPETEPATPQSTDSGMPAMSLLSTEPGDDPALAPNQADQEPRQGHTTSWLNLRNGPGIHHDKTSLIPPQTQVAILEGQGDWLRITTSVKGKSVEGWVHTNYIQWRNKPEDMAIPPPPANE
jgi:lipopolysaccharide export system protein LptA